MQEATQLDNVLIRDDQTSSNEKPFTLYDPEAQNRQDLEVRLDGFIYDVTHVFNPLSEERYLQWIKEFRVKGDEDSVQEESREATIRLWDDLIDRVENVEFETEDWKSAVPMTEKSEAVKSILAVAVVDGEERATTKLRRGSSEPTQTVITEAWFNGKAVKQKHVLKATTIELEKKYSRIQGKRFRQQKIGGLRSKPKVEFVPQDERIAELYDDMLISVSGFAGDKVPIRFKTTAVHSIFAPSVDVKQSEKK
jgi:hypothetical protein